ncbi:hypothetical protein ABZS61_10915 [Streptomyces sp. NPDC005566]|uniref:hypothetical protein n=1 Tax=Streptomyces sp. NPDC005566 TaxID=3156886 RepID=UPI0033B3022A
MTHVEPAHLVELALGNDVSSDDVTALRHIVTCVSCQEELNRIARVVTAARGVEASDLTTAPPDRVWRRITQEVSRTGESASVPTVGGHRLPTGEHRSGRSVGARIRTAHLVLGLLAGAVVIGWIGRRTANIGLTSARGVVPWHPVPAPSGSGTGPVRFGTPRRHPRLRT